LIASAKYGQTKKPPQNPDKYFWKASHIEWLLRVCPFYHPTSDQAYGAQYQSDPT